MTEEKKAVIGGSDKEVAASASKDAA